MAVVHDVAIEDPGGTSLDTSVPHSFDGSSLASSEGILVLVWANTSNSSDITGVTYGGLSLDYIAAIADSAGETGSVAAYFIGSLTGASGSTIEVNKAAAIDTWAVAIGVSCDAGGTPEVYIPGVGFVVDDGTLAEQNVDDGSPGTNSQRYAIIYSGLASPPPVGANSTSLQTIDIGQRGAAVCRRTSAGQGSLPVGFSSGSSDDRAGLFLAVREVSGGGGPTVKHLAALGVG